MRSVDLLALSLPQAHEVHVVVTVGANLDDRRLVPRAVLDLYVVAQVEARGLVVARQPALRRLEDVQAAGPAGRR